MSVIQGNAIESGVAQYKIERSLRFNSADTAYLNRTPASAGNRKTWTWSGWVKRGSLGSDMRFFEGYVDTSNWTVLSFDSADRIQLAHRVGGSSTYNIITTAVYRDPSAWYHIAVAFDTTQATSSERVKLYVNGIQVTALTTNTIGSQNTDTFVNATNSHHLGRYGAGSQYFDGYLTEINFIDGSALDPTSFGEYNTDTGVWQPKKYAGTYGTNGFYLNFSDNSGTTSTTLGKDYSGNGNNWTPNNFSVTAGAGNDSMVDVPTNYGTDTGVGGEVRGNYATLNPLNRSTGTAAANLVDGNLRISPSGGVNATPGAYALAATTFQVSSGKWYFEAQVVNPVGGYGANAGWTNSVSFNFNQSNIYTGNITQVSASMGNTSLRMIAYDADAGKVWIGTSGTWDSGDPATGTGGSSLTAPAMPFAQAFQANGSNQCDVVANFGQRPFAYTAPSGFKALCTQNLPEPTIVDGGEYFNTVLYTGNGSTQSITGVGFQPDWVWVKGRSGATDHGLYDAVRGVQKQLESNTTTAETTETTGLTAFGSDGFTVGALAQLNTSLATYVAWNWKANGSGVTNTDGTITSTVSANTDSGFSIVTYTGNGTGGSTVGHGLGAKPGFIITKQRSAVSGVHWRTYHQSLTANGSVYLNLTNAYTGTDAGFMNLTEPTSSVFTVGSDGNINGSGQPQLAYCFSEVAGYSAFGSYTGNGSADGPFVYTGFKPAFVMVKQTSASGQEWCIQDNKRLGYNPDNAALFADLSSAEYASNLRYVDFTSNGFKIRNSTSNQNGSGATYIYMAFAEVPMKFALAR